MNNDRCFLFFFFSLLRSGVSLIIVDIFTAQLSPESQDNKKATTKKVSKQQRWMWPVGALRHNRGLTPMSWVAWLKFLDFQSFSIVELLIRDYRPVALYFFHWGVVSKAVLTIQVQKTYWIICCFAGTITWNFLLHFAAKAFCSSAACFKCEPDCNSLCHRRLVKLDWSSRLKYRM